MWDYFFWDGQVKGCGIRAVCMLTAGLKTPRIKSDQRDELPEMARRPERKNEKLKKVARGASCVLHTGGVHVNGGSENTPD